MQKGKFRRPSSAPAARKERSCQSYSASHIKWRAERSFHRPTFIRPGVNFLLMCRSLSRPSHSRPFNMHCPPRAQLLAVAYLGIIRMNIFFLRKGGRTGRREGKKRRSSILNLLTKKVSFFSFPPFSACATHSSPACRRLWNPRYSALEKPWKARSGKKFDSRKIKLVFYESFYAKRNSAMNVQSNKVKTKNKKVEAFSVVYRIYSEEHCPD